MPPGPNHGQEFCCYSIPYDHKGGQREDFFLRQEEVRMNAYSLKALWSESSTSHNVVETLAHYAAWIGVEWSIQLMFTWYFCFEEILLSAFYVTAENRDLRQGGLRICMALAIFLGMTEFRSPLLSAGGIFIYLFFIWEMFIYLHGLIVILHRDLLGRMKQKVASAFFRFAYCFFSLSFITFLHLLIQMEAFV